MNCQICGQVCDNNPCFIAGITRPFIHDAPTEFDDGSESIDLDYDHEAEPVGELP